LHTAAALVALSSNAETCRKALSEFKKKNQTKKRQKLHETKKPVLLTVIDVDKRSVTKRVGKRVFHLR
jgi:hypothetical protein